jgi:hypothetical protein
MRYSKKYCLGTTGLVLHEMRHGRRNFKDTNPLMSSSLVILFGVVKQFGRFWIWSETECKIPSFLWSTVQFPPPLRHTLSVYTLNFIWVGGGGEDRRATVHKYSSFVHGGKSSQAGSEIPTNEWMYLQSIKSVKQNAANSVNRSISRLIGFGVFIVHSSMRRAHHQLNIS